jgi:hypothetical protein
MGAKNPAQSNLPKLDRKNGLDDLWNDWITAHVLVREAKAVIEGTSPSGVGQK